MKVCDDGVRNLACGVCAKAVEDYVRLKKRIRKAEHAKPDELFRYRQVKEFIRSQTFTEYSGGLDGRKVIAELDRRHGKHAAQ